MPQLGNLLYDVIDARNPSWCGLRAGFVFQALHKIRFRPMVCLIDTAEYRQWYEYSSRVSSVRAKLCACQAGFGVSTVVALFFPVA